MFSARWNAQLVVRVQEMPNNSTVLQDEGIVSLLLSSKLA